MLRLSKLTDYAVVVLARLSFGPPTQTSPGIAAATGIPEPTVAKVLKTLVAAGLVASQRGAHGGYRRTRPLAALPIADVIEAIDGPIALTACVEGAGMSLDVALLCPMRGRWDPVNAAIPRGARRRSRSPTCSTRPGHFGRGPADPPLNPSSRRSIEQHASR